MCYSGLQMDGHELRSILFFVILKALEGSNGPYIWEFKAQVSFHNLRLGLGLKNATVEWNVHVFKLSQHEHDDQSRTSQHKPTISQAGSKPINSLEKVCKYKPIFHEFVNEYSFTAGCSTQPQKTENSEWMMPYFRLYRHGCVTHGALHHMPVNSLDFVGSSHRII